MKNVDIQFYGERGIVNGILLDIGNDKDKLNKFFQAIKLFGTEELPWKNGVDSCKWMIEPSFAYFGDPDLIAVIEVNKIKYALFIEAKLDDYIKSCISLVREDGLVDLKGQSSKLNVQLSLRYRFVQAFQEALKKKEFGVIQESSSKHPDGMTRKLQKGHVINAVKGFLDKVNEYYYIALTNGLSSENAIRRIKASRNYHPPLFNGKYNDFEKYESNFGILTYGELIKNGVVEYGATKEMSFFYKACKMMGFIPTVDTSRNSKINDPNSVQTKDLLNLRRIKSVNINHWDRDLQKLAQRFVESQSLKFSFIKRSGSYSLELGSAVVMKLMLYQQNEKNTQVGTEKKLILGFSDCSVFDDASVFDDEIPPLALTVGVGERGRTFYFCFLEEHNIDRRIELANNYYKSLIKRPEPIDVWQSIPKEGIKGTLSGLQYNTGLWTSQATVDSAEDFQESNDLIAPYDEYDELRLLIVKDNNKDIEVVMERLFNPSLHALGSIQKDRPQVYIRKEEDELSLYRLYITQDQEHKCIASSKQIKWKDCE